MERAVTLVMEFPSRGPAAGAVDDVLRKMAEELPRIPGLCWKIWTEDAEQGLAGGIYRFADRRSAEAYRDRQAARLAAIGVMPVRVRLTAAH
ncbi:YdhR family protein [Roseomonas sp. OT10]|uniref:YdhR family protein n=1 Tax=Roseomonas cutis TaxID=2897332 RepID=UPI001E3D5D69|nr:YdhR family protein [Roseomonas sp. OT10]UFN48770.1 YdhR family protein [Roseomonas sp. OT10]